MLPMLNVYEWMNILFPNHDKRDIYALIFDGCRMCDYFYLWDETSTEENPCEIEILAAESGLSKRITAAYINELIEEGYVEMKPIYVKKKFHHNEYRIVDAKWVPTYRALRQKRLAEEAAELEKKKREEA